MKQDFSHKRLSRLYFIMRVSFANLLLLVIPCLQVLSAETACGQNVHEIFVRIDVENVSLEKIFKIIEDQTEFLFVYSPELIEAYNYVSFKNDHISVGEFLDKILHNLPVAFKKSNDNILLFRKDIKNVDQTETIPIRGRVLGTDGTPLPGVNVVVKGTTVGTSTGADGYYSIDTPIGSNVLVFSFIGYKPITTEIGSSSTIDIVLEEDVAQLNEVVVNGGYYETTDKLKTGSIFKVTAKDIEKQPVTSPLMALQGRVPGLEITPSNGVPGVAPQIRIRGTNSLRVTGKTASVDDAGNYPLYVIDGVPINPAPVYSYGGSYTAGGYDPLSTLSPSAIESIEILKDGDATAIYGSRGANGVVVITTKRSSKTQDKTNIEVSAYTGVGKVSKHLDLLNTDQYLSMRKEALANDGLVAGVSDPDLTLWDQSRYTDWQKVLIGGTAKINDFQASISSGNHLTSFRAGGGFHKETMVFPGDFKYSRGSVQFSLNHRSSNSKLRFALSANYGIDNNNLFNDSGSLVNAALSLPPNAPNLHKSDGSLNWEEYVVSGKSIGSWNNPLSATENRQKTNTHNLTASANLSYEIFQGFSISASGGYTDLSNSEIGKFPRSGQLPDSSIPGSANFLNNKRNSWIIEPKASFTRKISDHTVDALVGTTWQQSINYVNTIAGQQYVSDALLGSIKSAGLVTIIREDNIDYRYMSQYARLGYNYRQRYLLNLTGRRDGSSRFGPGNRFGNFGSVAAGWIFSSEPILQSINKILNFGKLRASFGITGSDQVGDYRYLDLYDISQNKYNGILGFNQKSPLNRNYAWEVTNKWEAALELGFFENRIGIEINAYRNRSSSQLIDYTLPVMTGFTSVLMNFPATIENTGWEAFLKADLLSSGAWRWNASVNVSLPRNKLVRFDGLETSPYSNYYKIGEPLSIRLLYSYVGINQETGRYNFIDQNNDGQITAADKTLQMPNDRAFYGGITNSIQFKGFDISVLFQFSKQKATNYFATIAPGRMRNQPVNVLGQWQNAGDQATAQQFSTSAESSTSYVNFIQSNQIIVDAAFIRLKTLSVGYRLSHERLSSIGLSELKLFVQGQNLFTITNYPGLDPETGSGLPPLRMVTAGIQCKL